MAFGSVTVGTTSQASKGWIQTDNSRLTVNFRVPYDADHTSPAEDSDGTPVHFVQMDALVAGDRMRFGVWNNEGKNGSVKAGHVAVKDVYGGGGTATSTATRVIKSSKLSFLGDSGQSFRMGIVKMPSASAATDWIGVTNSIGSTGQMTWYTKSWKKLDQFSDPFYGKIYYNTVPSQVLAAGLVATATPSNSMLLSWGAPASSGGDQVNGYRIEWSTSASFDTLSGSIQDTHTLARSRVLTGLQAATTYYVRVAALNGVTDKLGKEHSGPWSDTVSAATAAGVDVEALRNDVADRNYMGLRAFQSAYAVQDANGNVVPTSFWLSYGGDVRVQVTGPGRISMTLIGPNRPIPGYPGDYTFAIRNEDGQDRSAITLRAWGATSAPTTVKMNTGATPSVTQVTESRLIDNVILGTKAAVWERATLSIEEHSGAVSEISFTIGGDRASTFLPGTCFRYDDAIWRVSSVSVSNASATITAKMYTLARDVDAGWYGQTVDQRDAALADVDADDLSIKPLYKTT